MKPIIYLADCSDLGLLKELDEADIEYELKHKYYYPTGADHPGVWIVIALYVVNSISSGYIYDKFKQLLSITSQYAKKQNIDWNENGPYHHGIVLESENLKIEYAITEELSSERIAEVIEKVKSVITKLGKTKEFCHAQIPVEEYDNHFSYERSRGKNGDRFWLFNFDSESVVYIEPEDIFIRNAQI
jgi:hypothetical protein